MRTYRLQVRLLQFSVFLSILVVTAGFLGAWGNSSGEQTKPTQSAAEMPPAVVEKVKIVALGDSYTFGYPGNQEKSWTSALAKMPNVIVVNKGKTYQTAQDLLARFDADVLSEKPHKVIIFAGNGDALRGVTLAAFQLNIRTMVQKAEANSIVPVLALPMPYPTVQQAIKEMREWEMKYAQEKKLMLLDFSVAVLDADLKYLDGFSKDGKYPTEKGYQAMGEYAAQILK